MVSVGGKVTDWGENQESCCGRVDFETVGYVSLQSKSVSGYEMHLDIVIMTRGFEVLGANKEV